jgi:hypothetical protein
MAIDAISSVLHYAASVAGETGATASGKPGSTSIKRWRSFIGVHRRLRGFI